MMSSLIHKLDLIDADYKMFNSYGVFIWKIGGLVVVMW